VGWGVGVVPGWCSPLSPGPRHRAAAGVRAAGRCGSPATTNPGRGPSAMSPTSALRARRSSQRTPKITASPRASSRRPSTGTRAWMYASTARQRYRPGLCAPAEPPDSPRNPGVGGVPAPQRYAVGLGLRRPRPRRHRHHSLCPHPQPAGLRHPRAGNPIAVRDGHCVLEEGKCSPSGRLTRCPNRPYDPENPTDSGYCLGWHSVLVPAHQSSAFTGEGGLTLTRFIVEAAAGERIPFQRDGHQGWLPLQQWQQYLEANGPALDDKEHRPSVRQGDRRDRCAEDRPVSEERAEPKQTRGSRSIVLESRPRETETVRVVVDASGQPIPLCRFGCGQPASMSGPEGLPEHYSCRPTTWGVICWVLQGTSPFRRRFPRPGAGRGVRPALIVRRVCAWPAGPRRSERRRWLDAAGHGRLSALSAPGPPAPAWPDR
jgi:hypothetical protein